MSLRRAAITVAIVGAVSLAGAREASATLITVDCTSPTFDLNPPVAGSAVSICGTLFLPVSAVVTDVAILARYSVTRQQGSTGPAAAEFGHTTNVNSSFDNGGAATPTLVSAPFSDLPFSPVFCPSVACTSALSALIGGIATITTFADSPSGVTSGVSGDYQWSVNYRLDQVPVPAAVPEPTSMLLLATGLVGLVAHRRRRSKQTVA